MLLPGDRIKRVAPYLKGEEGFCVTYSDTLSSVNLAEVVVFIKHRERLQLW